MISLAIFSYEVVEMKTTKYISNFKDHDILKFSFFALIGSGFFIYASGKFLIEKIYLGRFRPREFEYVQKYTSCELNSYKPNKNPINCIQKSSANNRVIWLFGDSHASNLTTSLREAAYQNGYDELLFLTNSNLLNGVEGNTLTKFFKSQIKKGDLIVFAHSYPKNRNAKKWYLIDDKIKRIIRISQDIDSKLILVDGFPKFFGKINYYSRFLFSRKNPSVSRIKVEETRSYLTKIMIKYVDNESVFYIDPLDSLCSLDNCPSVINNKLIYSDTSPHFTIQGSTILTNLFREKISELSK